MISRAARGPAGHKNRHLSGDNDNNGSYQGVPYETPFLHALNNLGYLYDDWDVINGHAGATPVYSDMLGYDAILWETAYNTANPVSPDDITHLEQYLDSGGKLYLDSMDMLSLASLPGAWTANYLGIASWSNNTRANTENGVSGDPITNGMVLPLTFPVQNANRIDTVNPTADAAAIFFSETNNPNAVRHQSGNFQVVFSSVIQNAISEADPAPNNSQTLIQNILNWFFQQNSSGVPGGSALAATRILAAQPNPFSPRTDLSFSLSARAAAGPVALSIVDASGRVVRNLVSGRMGEGLHHVGWDGTRQDGHPAPAGLYFAHLRSQDGVTTQKLVMMK